MRERMKSWADESEPRVGCRYGWDGLSHSQRPEKRQMLVQGINNEFSKADDVRGKGGNEGEGR